MTTQSAYVLKSVIQEKYGFLFEPELIEEITQFSVYKEIEAGEVIIDYHDFIKSMPLILEGAIKVMRQNKSGDEILLYFVESGDTCAMTLNCCVGRIKSTIKAVAETHTQMILVPVEKMEEWMSRFSTWRSFVLSSYHARLMEAIETIESIAFLNMDERLMKYLQDKTKINHSSQLSITHEEIAADLNTSRVVISRLLKQLENTHRVALSRNMIEVIDL
jgi:CRP/FNR family transcriptional regulator, anaerobic regulatory protein